MMKYCVNYLLYIHPQHKKNKQVIKHQIINRQTNLLFQNL